LDDFTYTVPEGTTGVPNVWRRNLLEGRWLTYAWWLAIGQHGTPLTASLLYVTAYVVLVAGLWRVLHLGLPHLHWGVDTLLVLSVFVSPIWVQLFYWPATLTPSTVVAALGVWLLPAAARRRRWLVVWMATASMFSVLTYAPVGAVLFLSAVVLLAERPWRELLWLTGAFLGGFALGVVIIYTLNLLAFGRFGLEIAAWRRPNPVHDLHDLRVNAGRFSRHLAALVRQLWLPALVSLAAVLAGLLDRAVRPRLLRLLFGLAVVVGIGLAQILVTGVVTATRGELWAWLAVLLPAVLLLGGSRTSRLSGLAGLIVLTVVGVLAWRGDLGAHQQTRAQYAAIVADATRPRLDGSAPKVVVYQDPALRGTVRGGTMAGIIRMMLRVELGAVPEWCADTQCAPLAEAAQAHQTGSTGAGSGGPSESPEEAARFVVEVGDVRGVLVPPLPPWWS
ncbi:MAG TPA: hypothetical protein VFN43_10945, partial [Humibacillus sp.]|nr:hypothetical protein [Humibacillus sp.]